MSILFIPPSQGLLRGHTECHIQCQGYIKRCDSSNHEKPDTYPRLIYFCKINAVNVVIIMIIVTMKLAGVSWLPTTIRDLLKDNWKMNV